MSFVGVIVLFLFLTAIIGIGFAYINARQKAQAYKQGRRKYATLVENLTDLRGHVVTEADRWPIYARPVMFTEIDHDAQIEFARAQQALEEAASLAPEIETIPEPETPERFDLKSLLHINKNLRTISIGNRLIGSLNLFAHRIGSLEKSVKTLKADWYKAEKKRREVRQSIKELKKNIVATNTKLKAMETWDPVAVNQLSWAMNVADNCHLAAHEQVMKQSDDEQGYLEHAIADVYVQIGNFALECLTLSLNSQSISRIYDLDIFTGLFRSTTDYLQSILELGDLNGWRKLQRAKPYIDRFPETIQAAENSLDDFKRLRDTLEELIQRINDLDLQKAIEETILLEKECTTYWYSYDERRADWQMILGNHPLPSVELNQVQSNLVTDILPSIGVDMIISQSIMPQLIAKIEALFRKHEVVRSVIRRLAAELRRHKEAQKIVHALIAPGGQASLGIGELEIVLQDTSPDINESGRELTNSYRGYVQRAETIRGANFPDLKEKLELLVQRLASLISQHAAQLSNLEATYENLHYEIREYVAEINQYMHATPSLDSQILTMFGRLYNAGWAVLRNSMSKRYSWLTNETSNMERWLELANPYVMRAREKYEAFFTARSQADKQFIRTKEQLGAQRLIVRKNWGWVREEIIPLIDQAEKELDSQINEWKRHEQRKWAELPIHKATALCGSQAKLAEQLPIELTKKIGEIYRQQKLLQSKATYIKQLATENASNLTPDDRQVVNTLISLAKSAENRENAETFLEYANSIALNRANIHERRTIRKIIVNKISGGGTIVQGNVDTGGGKFTGRDDNSYASKDRSRSRRK